MNKYHVLVLLISLISSVQNIFSCPCMPSTENKQPFFEQNDTETDSDNQNEENNEKETVS